MLLVAGRVTLGSGPGVDIPVQGTGVLPIHCNIENSEGVVTIYPLSENLSIDGSKITGPTRLSQGMFTCNTMVFTLYNSIFYLGVMLTIGRSNYMRFNHPAEAKLMKSVLPNSRISMAPISFNVEPKHNKKPPTIPRKSPRESLSDSSCDDAPSSIMTKVSKFEYLAAQNMKQSISPKVFSSNLITVNTPAKDVLGKTPDLQSLTKHLPQSAVNYSDLTDKEKNKTPDRQLFGRKSPQYVNVAINEAKTINNRVILYETDCISKAQNVNNDQNKDLNNMNTKNNKNCIKLPSPAYNRNPGYFRSATSSPVVMNGLLEHKINGDFKNGVSGSLENLNYRKKEAEIRRNQV